jgi:hypothetical protein
MKKQFFYIALMILFVSTTGNAQGIIYTNAPQQFDQYKLMPANQVSTGKQPAADPAMEIQQYMLAKVDENIHRNFGSDYEKVIQKNPAPTSAAKYGKYMYSVGVINQAGQFVWVSVPLKPDDMILAYDGKPYAIQTPVSVGRQGSVMVWAPLSFDKENPVTVKEFNRQQSKSNQYQQKQQLMAANPQLAMEIESNRGQQGMMIASAAIGVGFQILDRVMQNNYMKAMTQAQNAGSQSMYQNAGYNTGGGGVHIGNGVVVATGGIQRAF